MKTMDTITAWLDKKLKKTRKINKVSAEFGRDLEKHKGRSLWLSQIPYQLGRVVGSIAEIIERVRRSGSYLSRAEKRRRIGKVTAKYSLIASAGFLTILLLKNPIVDILATLEIFYVKDISIEGCRRVDTGIIREKIVLDRKTSLVTLKTADIEQRIIDLPWISSVSVKKHWPDRVDITIKEQVIHGLLAKGDGETGRLYYIDVLGNVIIAVSAGEELDFPVITGFDNYPKKGRPELMKDAMIFIRQIARNDPNLPAQSVSEIHLDKDRGMVIRLVDYPFPIYFGQGEVKKKYKQLHRVLGTLYKNRNKLIRKVKYIQMDYLENKVLVAQTESS